MRKLEGSRFEISLGDSAYPPLLASIHRPPKRIYGIGNPEALRPGVAVIGARKATPYGLECARVCASHAARRGLTIVSGGARGCDQIAHQAALDEGAPTVVVFGCGADVPYPKTGYKHFCKVIQSGGAIISENPWGTAPLPRLFPQRNRIIAGLALLLLIAEAGMPSGTFSTADAALSEGREVAAVPGAIFSAQSLGSNKLIAQGAIPIVDMEALDECLEEAFQRAPLSMMERGGEEALVPTKDIASVDPILHALTASAYAPDELAEYYGLSPSDLLKRLSQYELQGLVQRGRDGRYQVCKRLT